MGHIKRCIVLAHELVKQGAVVKFLCREDPYAKQLLGNEGFASQFFDLNYSFAEDLKVLNQTAANLGSNMVVIDSHEINASYREKVMENFFLISIDDIAHQDIPSHIVVNGNLGAKQLSCQYAHSSKMLLGAEYAILSEDYSKSMTVADNLDQIRHVLITMGGIDHFDLTTRILRILERSKLDFYVTVIAGPYYDNLESINRQVACMTKRVRVVHSVPTLYPYMKACSLAFSAGGQTLYELVALGRPTIGISLSENQAGTVAALVEAGAIFGMIYHHGESFDEELERCAERMMENQRERVMCSTGARLLIDGLGARRIAQMVLKEFSEWQQT
jgi:UDP-2,4-diacetamido-2,4,6-trideoxy-beta-L-altropyranose hydrolase